MASEATCDHDGFNDDDNDDDDLVQNNDNVIAGKEDYFVTAMICSPLESNCVPLPQ